MNDEIKKKLVEFFNKYKYQEFKKSETLIRADDDPTGIFFIQEGIVREYYISKKGDEITLNMFKPFAFFPLSWAVAHIHNVYNFEAMTDCKAIKAPKEDVLHFLEREPKVMIDLLRRLYIGMQGLWTHIEYLSAGNAQTKLISSLIILAKRFGKKGNEGIVIQLKLSEKELGEYAGMYRETVSRELQSLRKKNLVLFEKGSITIPDLQKLEDELTL